MSPAVISTTVLSASAMMAVTGFVTWIILRSVSIESWRLRSILAVAVLMQGLMFIRSPVHLGLVEAQHDSTFMVTEALEIDISNLSESAVDPRAATVISAVPKIGSERLASMRLWQAAKRMDWWRPLITIWVVVAAAMFVVLGWRYVRVLRLLNRLDPAPESWQRCWRSLVKQSGRAGDAARCEMLVSQSVGPLLVRRPGGYSLVVPETYWGALSSDQQRGVMLHELAHMERADVWRQFATRFVTSIHWFNPAAWWALRQYETAAECACDARVAREGKRMAAGFASALLEFVEWNSSQPDSSPSTPTFLRSANRSMPHRGIGVQAMDAPPLTVRISRLLQPSSSAKDSIMKRLALVLFAVVLVALSFFQIRLTAKDGDSSATSLHVMDKDTQVRLDQIVSKLDTTDPTTKRFAELFNTSSGKIAIAGMLDSIRSDARAEARSEAVPRFMKHHFTETTDGKLAAREESKPALDRWVSQSQRLGKDLNNLRATMNDIAGKLDTSTEVGGLFQRLLRDPQAPVAIVVEEMDGGDVVTRFISKALEKILVDQGDGTFVIVESRRDEAQKLTEMFELSATIAESLKRELPLLAADYSTADQQHQDLVRYFKNPTTAIVAALTLAGSSQSAADAVNKLHEHFEEASLDTAKGLEIVEAEAWDQLREIFERVDRAESVVSRVQQRLSEVAETLSKDDNLTVRFAEQMQADVAAIHIASELPYAEADAGEEFRALMSEVLVESNDKFSVREDRVDALSEKSRELLQTCRKIRRYTLEIDDFLEQLTDQHFVQNLGDAGRYTLLHEVRRFAERHHPNPIELMQEHLLVLSDENNLCIREEQREVVRKLVAQAERVRAEEGKDDF